jgi:3-hydroxyacyl-CoA dehydrogenase
VLRERFLTVGQAKVATSAYEAFDLGYLREGVDEVELDRTRLTARAKIAAAAMADAGYVPPRERTDITVLGQEGLGIVHVGAHSMKSAGYISDHDQHISVKLGTVLCGGDLSAPTKVSERYLLDIERKAFAELCRERKSLERMQSLIQTGKILRN